MDYRHGNAKDVLNQVKGCEFHYLQFIDKHANEAGESSEKFKSLEKGLFYSGTQKHIRASMSNLRHF